MDQRLTPADPRDVRRLMARAYLASPAIPADQGQVRLAPHQVDAASRVLALLAQWGGAVLADATGLGKTFVAIAVARLHAPTLIVAPAALRGMWQESLGRAGVSARVTSYEALSRGSSPDGRPALLVLDEAHHARNPATRRYAHLAGLAWGARVLLLTATPVHNRNRDVRALVALFLGSRADGMTDDELLRVMVRRTPEDASDGAGFVFPAINTPRWLTVPGDPETLRAIVALPEAAPASDGVPAHALTILGLIRAWSSSEAALRETLRRRLRRAASLGAALESGRFPSRRELASWPVIDDAIQLGFAGLFGPPDEGRVDIHRLRAALDEHVEGVRAILQRLDRNDGAADRARVRSVRAILDRKPSVPVVAFTQFVDTAVAMFRHCAPAGGAALVTGRGARVVSGQVSVDEIVRGFDVAPGDRSRHAAMPLRLLVASDVLSEGLSLRRAGVLVHLDLPWTLSRLEQRVGRLRRIGSAHAVIDAYAIGPPVSARELVPVLRALQRKARVTTALVGDSELQSSLPLLGRRLTTATAALNRIDAREKLRACLRDWMDGRAEPAVQSAGTSGRPCALTLITGNGVHRLIAVDGEVVGESPEAVLRAVVLLGAGRPSSNSSCDLSGMVAPMARWLEEQHGRELARPATESPSAAHAAVLRMLQERLQRATRIERAALGTRIEACRRLVLGARGVGAERALSRIDPSTLDLEVLERLLRSRTGPETAHEAPRLVAVLGSAPGTDQVVSGSVTDGSW